MWRTSTEEIITVATWPVIPNLWGLWRSLKNGWATVIILVIFGAACHMRQCWRVLSKETWQFSLPYKNKIIGTYIKCDTVSGWGVDDLGCSRGGIRRGKMWKGRKEERKEGRKKKKPRIDEIITIDSRDKGTQ